MYMWKKNKLCLRDNWCTKEQLEKKMKITFKQRSESRGNLLISIQEVEWNGMWVSLVDNRIEPN